MKLSCKVIEDGENEEKYRSYLIESIYRSRVLHLLCNRIFKVKLFWFVMRRVLFSCNRKLIFVIACRCFGTTNKPHVLGKNTWTMKIGPLGCHKTAVSVVNYTLFQYLKRSQILCNTIVAIPCTESTLQVLAHTISLFNFTCHVHKFLSYGKYVLKHSLGLPQYLM
jgi:hypothetical protein